MWSNTVFSVDNIILLATRFCFVLIPKEPALQGGLNRAPGTPVVKTTPGKHITQVQKLLQLAEVEGLRVQFTDYPKVRTCEL